MDQDSLKALHFDRRLAHRKGHLDPSELEAHIASLPDVSDKIAGEADETPAAADAGHAPESGEVPTPAAPE